MRNCRNPDQSDLYRFSVEGVQATVPCPVTLPHLMGLGVVGMLRLLHKVSISCKILVLPSACSSGEIMGGTLGFFGTFCVVMVLLLRTLPSPFLRLRLLDIARIIGYPGKVKEVGWVLYPTIWSFSNDRKKWEKKKLNRTLA